MGELPRRFFAMHYGKFAVALFLPILTMQFLGPRAEAHEFVHGALGDSISVAFNCGRLGCKRYSWATGRADRTQVMSHYHRLQEIFVDVRAINVARAGAVASELPGQARRLVDRAKPDYVTILIGANDLCRLPDDHQDKLDAFSEDLRATVEILLAENPDVKILMSALPDMMWLHELGTKHDCQSRWNLFNMCQRLLNAERTPGERLAFSLRQQDVNNAIEQIAEEYPANARFAGDVARVRFEIEHVSAIDCFHPSVEGQDFLAGASWQPDFFH